MTMADASTKRVPQDQPGDSSANGTGSLEELRHLILAPEQEALERLHHRVANPRARTEDVSSVVAEAIQLRREQGGSDALSEALAPTIETAVRESVRKDPSTLADALFPVMGPAIRRSILETLRSFLDSFNQIMDQSLSLQGLTWRLEAVRTGRTFTEVVLLHSLVFRVEQVFLIHKKTGLSLGHAVAPSVAMQDPSLVSGMLSAIQDFVRDSFHSGPGEGIERLNVGDLDVWVEAGPYAILACVIRGIAPRALRDTMAEVLENIHREYSAQLDRFTGDSAPFSAVNKELSRCLEYKYKESASRKGYGYVWAAGGMLLLLVGGFLGWRWWQYHRWNDLVDTLREQPGLVITSFAREHGRFSIRGLRDPLAPDPRQFVTQAGLDPAKSEFHWGAYYALDDAILQLRATQLLAPPQDVTLNVKDGILHLAGQPSASWLKDLRTRALLVPGLRSVDFGRFTPEQMVFDQAKSDAQGVIVKFPVGTAALSAAERSNLRNLIPKLTSLQNSAVALHQNLRLEVVGHSDATGAEGSNQSLSQRRADRVAWELMQLGIPDDVLHPRGVASAEPVRSDDTEENRQFNRSVTFLVSSPPSLEP
jgi:outer membrane protein OmpA-like peptidoglycan-associated protein